MKKISVIVPIYNVEKFLPQCLDSLLTQTLTELEIICVNDGSPDNCSKILDDYIKKDNRIIVINKIVPIKVFKDISTDYKAIQNLVKRLNDGKVELIHVDDIIEDFYFDNV